MKVRERDYVGQCGDVRVGEREDFYLILIDKSRAIEKTYICVSV